MKKVVFALLMMSSVARADIIITDFSQTVNTVDTTISLPDPFGTSSSGPISTGFADGSASSSNDLESTASDITSTFSMSYNSADQIQDSVFSQTDFTVSVPENFTLNFSTSDDGISQYGGEISLGAFLYGTTIFDIFPTTSGVASGELLPGIDYRLMVTSTFGGTGTSSTLGSYDLNVTPSPASVPEPSSMVLMMVGGLIVAMRRKGANATAV